MGFFDNFFGSAKRTIAVYTNDYTFLHAATAAAALVINADGVVEKAEVDSALEGLLNNEILKGSFKSLEISSSLTEAIGRSKTRSGKVVLNRQLEDLADRPETQRQDVFLIAADVGDTDKETDDQPGIGTAELAVLNAVGKLLGLDANKLLAA